MNSNKSAKFKRLVKQGDTPDQIIQKMDISERSFYRYLNTTSIDLRKKEIDKKRYFELLSNGDCSKLELAERLGVTRPTLLNFEKRCKAASIISRGEYVQGRKLIVPGILHITKATADEYTNGLPTISGTTKNLKIILGILEEFAAFDPETNTTIRTISDAMNLLQEVQNKQSNNL